MNSIPCEKVLLTELADIAVFKFTLFFGIIFGIVCVRVCVSFVLKGSVGLQADCRY